jgi:hypothetical protein
MSQTKAQLVSGLSINASAPATSLNIDSSGRVLVGTSTALGVSSKLEVLNGNTVTSSYLANAFAQAWQFVKSRSTSTLGTIVQSGDELGNITWAGDDGTSTAKQAAAIQVYVDGTPGNNDMPGRLVFSTTADGASSPTEAARINSSGNLLIGVTSSAADCRTHIYKTVASGDVARIQNASGNTGVAYIGFRYGTGTGTETGYISTNGTNTAYNTSSDYRLKENITPLTGAIDRVSQLQVHRFNFIADPDRIVDGFIAHEAQAVVPECVTGEKDAVDEDGNPKYQGIDQSKLVPLLTAALQEALAEIESLKARVTALEP